MNKEGAKLHQQDLDPYAADSQEATFSPIDSLGTNSSPADSQEANSSPADIPANTDARNHLRTVISAATNLSAVGSSEEKFPQTDSCVAVSLEIKPSSANLPSADSSEAKPPATDLSDTGNHLRTDISAVTNLSAVDNSEAKSPQTDLIMAVPLEVKPSATNSPAADSSQTKPPATDSSAVNSSLKLLAAEPNATTLLADDANTTNSHVLKADVADPPGSAIESSGTDDSNIAEGDTTDEVVNTPTPPDASDDDILIDDRVSETGYTDCSDAVDVFTLLERGMLGRNSPPLEYPLRRPYFVAGANYLPDDVLMSGIDDEISMSSEGRPMSGIDDEILMSLEDQMSCIDDEIAMSSIQDPMGSDRDSGSSSSLQIDPPHPTDQGQQDQVQEALSRKRNIQRQRGRLDALALQEESSSSELSAQSSPARRPFFKSVKRTKAAPKAQDQLADSFATSTSPPMAQIKQPGSSAAPNSPAMAQIKQPGSSAAPNSPAMAQSRQPDSEASTSSALAQSQQAGSPEVSASSARDQSQQADSSEAATSSTRAQSQQADSSEAAISSARAQDEVEEPAEASTSLVRAQGQPAVLTEASTSSGRTHGHRANSLVPSGHFVRLPGGMMIPAHLLIPSISLPRTFGHSTSLPRIRGQPADSLVPSSPFPSIVVYSSMSAVYHGEQPIHLAESVVTAALHYGSRLGLVVARVVHVSPSHQTREELTQIMWDAIERRDGRTALYALNRGADPHYCRTPNWTTLHGSIVTGDLDFSLELVEMGAQVNRRSEPEGYTPLHLAAIWDRPNLAVLLLQNGARAAKKDLKGEKPLEYAIRRKHERMIRILNAAYVPDDSEDTEETEEETDDSDETSESL